MFYKRITIVTIVILIALMSFPQDVSAVDLNIIPRGGLSQPVGATAGKWQSGYTLELDLLRPIIDDRYTWGIRLGFHRWKPNAREMLKVGDRELEVEKTIGWRAIGELSGIASYQLMMLPKPLKSLKVEGGLGVFYVRQPDVYVKGFQAVGSSALNRVITLEHNSEITAGLSAGVSMIILNRIEPMVRYHYIFTADEATSILTFGIGLIAR